MQAHTLVQELDELRWPASKVNKVILAINPDHVEEARLIDGERYHIIQDFCVHYSLYEGKEVITIETKKSNP